MSALSMTISPEPMELERKTEMLHLEVGDKDGDEVVETDERTENGESIKNEEVEGGKMVAEGREDID